MERESIYWDVMASDPLFRQAISDIEVMSNADRMVGELVALFRGVDEMMDAVLEESGVRRQASGELSDAG